MRDTDADWEAVAQSQPYWGVLSTEKFEGKVLEAQTEEEFFASGNAYVDNLLGALHKFFPEVERPKRVLDFGCGVGRLALAFARYAEEVTGLDISPEMLRLARSHANDRGITNARFLQSDDNLSEASDLFDLVNSIIVLQHIPPERGLRIIERLVQKARPGGLFALQVTYGKARKFLVHEQGAARYYRRDGNNLVDLLPAETALPEGTITMFDYDLNAIIALLSTYSGSPILLLPTRDDDHLGVQFIGLRA